MPRNEDLPWPPPAQSRRAAPSREELLAPATQLVRDSDDYLGQGRHTLGRRIADDQVELFVGDDPAAALQHQLQQQPIEYIALHDVGTSASGHLLQSLAGAAGAQVQRLTIRRQGVGHAFASVPFVEIPSDSGEPLRIYGTDGQADPALRLPMSLVLLSHARLGALLVGDLTAASLGAALQPLRDALMRGAWSGRDLLVLPLGSATSLAGQAAQLSGHGGVAVRVTPQASTPQQAWDFISGTWNRLQARSGKLALDPDIRRAVPRPTVPRPLAPTQPMTLAPEPAPAQGLAPPSRRWADYAQRCAAVKGVTATCVFDATQRRPLAHTGNVSPERLAEQGHALLEAIGTGTRTLGFGLAWPEAAVTVGQQHLLLRPVPGHDGVVTLLLINASASNLTLARMQLERVAPPV